MTRDPRDPGPTDPSREARMPMGPPARKGSEGLSESRRSPLGWQGRAPHSAKRGRGRDPEVSVRPVNQDNGSGQSAVAEARPVPDSWRVLLDAVPAAVV